MMDRCNEARAYLEPKFINQLKEDDFIHRSSPDWNISSLGAAQSILEYNLSVVLVLQGETELARAMMNRCKHPIVMTHLKMLKVYMEMQAGNLEACRIMVRMDTPQYYWNVLWIFFLGENEYCNLIKLFNFLKTTFV